MNMSNKAGEYRCDAHAELLLAAAKELIAHSREKIFVKDKDFRYRGASLKFSMMAGVESPDDLIGKTDFEIFEDKELAQRYRNEDLKIVREKKNMINFIDPLTEMDGHARYASTSKFYLTNADGDFIGIVGVSNDITNEYYLKRHSNPVLEYMFDLPANVYFAAYIDLEDWRIIKENRQVVDGNKFDFHVDIQELFTKAYENIADRRWPAADFYRNFSKETIMELYESQKYKITLEYRRNLDKKTIRWVRDDIHLLKDNVSGHISMMLVVWDIHEAKVEEEERIRRAERDELTGLLNRKATMGLIREKLDNSFDDDKHALMMLDADYFKSVNDTYGHQAGDKVLVELAKEISGCFRSSDIVGRIGGDEFFILMTRIPDRATVEKKVRVLLDRIKGVYCKEIHLSASIGISMFPQDAGTLEEMYAKADKAMYAAKEARGRVVFAEDLSDDKRVS